MTQIDPPSTRARGLRAPWHVWVRISVALALISPVVVLGAPSARAATSLTVHLSGTGSVVSSPAGISCPPTCDHAFSDGAAVTLTATADGGSKFSTWFGCDANPLPNACAVALGSAAHVSAMFVSPVSVAMLDDLGQDPTSLPPNSSASGSFGLVRSGDTYFFSVDAATGDGCTPAELYATSGQPGTGHVVAGLELPQTSFANYDAEITSIGSGRVLFVGHSGIEPGAWDPDSDCDVNGESLVTRAFVSDGTEIGTTALRPAGAVGAAAGFYDLFSPPYGPAVAIAETASVGAVLIGRAYLDDGSTPLGARRPYWVHTDGTVTELTLPAGGSATDTSLLAAVGNKVFADVTDPTSGRELRVIDLGAGSPTWTVVSELSATSASTTNFASLDVAAGRLYFEANPAGADPRAYYVTDGSTVNLVATNTSLELSRGVAVADDWYFFRQNGSTHELWRYPALAGPAAKVWDCGGETPDEGWGNPTYKVPMAALGDALFFLCGESGGGWYDGLYRLGPESGTPMSVFEGPRRMETTTVAPIAFGGTLFFFGEEICSIECDGYVQRLFAYTGDKDPFVVPFGPDGQEWGTGWIRSQGERFVLWADDGVYGREPWMGKVVPTSPLSIAVSGPGSVSASPVASTPVAELASCTDTCTAPFGSGTRVLLTASWGESAQFVGWSSNCLPLPDQPNRCVVTMAGARTVGAVFAAEGDTLVVGSSGPASVGTGGLIAYSVVVGNVAPASDPIATTIDVDLTGGSTLDTTLTPWCTSAGGTSYSCPVDPIAYGSAKLFKIYATAPASPASVTADFTLSPGDAVTSTDSTSVAVDVVSDLIALSVVAYPATADAGGDLTYLVRIRNVGATSATGLTLHAGFNDPGAAGYAASSTATTWGCVASPGAPIFDEAVTCTPNPASLAAGSTLDVTFSATAPLATLSGLPLSATFWVDYTGSPKGLLDDDTAPPVATTITSTSLEQQGDELLTQSLDLSTAPTGATPSDPTGIDVTLPTGFAGLFSSTEIDEASGLIAIEGRRISIADTQSGTLAAPSTGEFACGLMPEYPSACMRFDVTIDEALGDSALVYLVTFRYDRSAFVSGISGRALALRRVRLFHMADGAMGYTPIPACRGIRLSTYTTYTGTEPCLLTKRVDRATGDYLFVVVTPENGSWKPGR